MLVTLHGRHTERISVQAIGVVTGKVTFLDAVYFFGNATDRPITAMTKTPNTNATNQCVTYALIPFRATASLTWLRIKVFAVTNQ